MKAPKLGPQKLGPRAWTILVVVVVLAAGIGALVYAKTATLGIEDKYAADVKLSAAFHQTGEKSFPWRRPPAQTWYYTSATTPGGIIDGLKTDLIACGFSVTTVNGQLHATNKDLNLTVGISRAAEQRAFTVAITATEVK